MAEVIAELIKVFKMHEQLTSIVCLLAMFLHQNVLERKDQKMLWRG